ncbi:MoaD/ThiS family protein [Moorella sulfitireducens]|uniref:MoaD/ThiS family protein n=1 Tax=Neomoorella sulfitireducens TaxID=2972948 RepID=UPI0021ACFAB1|nr:MoaD/ThiS family protein [Moorella sulfitireducens]
MKIKVEAILDLAQLLGGRMVEVEVPEGSTLRALVGSLIDGYGEPLRNKLIRPDTGEPYRYIRFMVNGRDIIGLQGLDTPLVEGDTVLILPPAAGG